MVKPSHSRILIATFVCSCIWLTRGIRVIEMCSADSVNQKLSDPFYLVTPNYPNNNVLWPDNIGCQCEMSVPQDDHIEVRSVEVELQNRRTDDCDSEYMMTSPVLALIGGEYDESIRYCQRKRFPSTSPDNEFIHAYLYDSSEWGKRGKGSKHLITGIPQKCNHGWSLHDDICYRMMTSPGNITFRQAHNDCAIYKALLTIIESKEQHDYYRQYILSHETFLLGADKRGSTWFWPDQTPVNFDLFDKHQAFTFNKNCSILDGLVGDWQKVLCDRVFSKGTKYVCQADARTIQSTPPGIKMSCRGLYVPVSPPTPSTTSAISSTTKKFLSTTSTGQNNSFIGKPVTKVPTTDVGLIAGISVVGLILLVVVIVAFILYRKRKQPSPNSSQNILPSSQTLNFFPDKQRQASVHSNGTIYQDPDGEGIYNVIDPTELDGYAVGGYVNQVVIETQKVRDWRKDIESGYVAPESDYRSEKGPYVDLSKLPVAPKPPGYKPKHLAGLTVKMPSVDNEYMGTLPTYTSGSTYTDLWTTAYGHLSQCYSDNIEPTVDYDADIYPEPEVTTGNTDFNDYDIPPPPEPVVSPVQFDDPLPNAPFPTLAYDNIGASIPDADSDRSGGV